MTLWTKQLILTNAYIKIWQLIAECKIFLNYLEIRHNRQRNSIWLVCCWRNKVVQCGSNGKKAIAFPRHCHFFNRQIQALIISKRSLFAIFCHGYKDLAWQSSWWGILFCVYVHIYWSKAVALFSQLLSTIMPERYSAIERRSKYNYMPRV